VLLLTIGQQKKKAQH